MYARATTRRLGLSIAALMLALPAALFAQTGTIVGKVVDRTSRQPVSEARVVVPGTTLEAQTNKDGDYRLNNVRPGRTVVGVFKIGHRAASDTVRVFAGQNATLNFDVVASLVTLSEVVVTGTAGNQERRAQSAQVGSIAASDIVKEAAVSNVGELLQSRLPGVAVNNNSGSVGTAKAIRIRGASSINLSNEPLVFIDGIRVNEGITRSGQSGQAFDRMNDLSPDEIESIEVVKGPAAATLYGADASAGVIQIITKKGRTGSNQFVETLRLEGGQSNVNWTPPDNYGNCSATAVLPTSTNPLCRGQTAGALVHDNPLLRIGAFRTGQDRSVGWNGRGGGQNFGYNLSFGSENDKGVLPNNNFDRYNVRSNFSFVPDSRVTFEAGLGLVQTKTALPDNDNNVFGWLGGALLGSPTTRTDDGSSRDGWYAVNRHYNAINSVDHSLLTHRVTTTLSANYLPVSWFTNRVTLGVDYAQDEQTNFFPRNDSTWYGGQTDGGSNEQTARGAERYTVDYLGNVRRLFGQRDQLESNLSFGLQVISTRNKFVQATGIGLVTNANNSIQSAATTSAQGGYTEQKTFGYLSQLQLGYENRFFVQFGVRVDKNSSFGVQAPSFVLPKVGASWTVSEEKFFAPLSPYVNSLRLRSAYGTTGRSPAPGDALTTLVATPFNLVPGASNIPGAVYGNPGNADLKPERGTEFEAGADASFWSDRLSTEVTYFNKVTNDLIIARPIAPSLGFASNPLANIGQVVNRGFEMTATLNALRTRNVDWDVRVNANTLHNELTDLGGIQAFNLNGQINRAVQGQQLGVFETKRIKNIDVAKSIVIVEDTLSPYANLLPTFEWNLSNTVTLFKNFRLTGLLDAKRNFSVYNNTQYFRETQLVRSNSRLDPTVLSRYDFLRRYGDDTPNRPAFVTESGASATVSDVYEAFIQPGDFVRLRELSASYDLPVNLLASVGRGISGATITLAFQNVKLWTKYEGADPEVVSNPNTTATSRAGQFSREDFLTLPNSKKTLLRLNLTF